MRICIRYVNSVHEAQDVLQESFIRIFKNINTSKFDSIGQLEAWMVRITVNEALRWIKKQQKFRTTDIDTAHFVTVSSSESTQADDLLRLIRQLPQGYRLVFNLYSIEGYSHKEIGELLNISESTSRSQLSRARTILKNALNKNYEKRV